MWKWIKTLAQLLTNKFNVDSEEVDQFLKAFAAAAEIRKQQPGHIFT